MGILVIGALVFVVLRTMLVAKHRNEFAAEWRAAPLQVCGVMVMTICLLTCVAGLFIRPLGRLPIHFGVSVLPFWQVAGLSFLACGFIGLVCERWGRDR